MPPSGDASLLCWIIHDWDDEKTAIILKNCHQAMPDDGKLLLVESIISPGNEPSGAKFIDLIMLLMSSGREHIEEEY